MTYRLLNNISQNSIYDDTATLYERKNGNSVWNAFVSRLVCKTVLL